MEYVATIPIITDALAVNKTMKSLSAKTKNLMLHCSKHNKTKKTIEQRETLICDKELK